MKTKFAQIRLGVKGTDAATQNQYLKQKMRFQELIYINLCWNVITREERAQNRPVQQLYVFAFGQYQAFVLQLSKGPAERFMSESEITGNICTAHL